MIEKIGEEKYQDLTNEIFKLMADIRLVFDSVLDEFMFWSKQ